MIPGVANPGYQATIDGGVPKLVHPDFWLALLIFQHLRMGQGDLLQDSFYLREVAPVGDANLHVHAIAKVRSEIVHHGLVGDLVVRDNEEVVVSPGVELGASQADVHDFSNCSGLHLD